MKLFSYWRSSSAWRVRIVLHAKGVPFTQSVVNIAPDVSAQDAADFATKNPLRQVPVLEWMDGGRAVRLSQSVAIAEYLETAYPDPALLPSESLLRARVREAVEIVGAGIQPLQNVQVQRRMTSLGGEAATAQWVADAIRQGLVALEVHARSHGDGYCVGSALTLADVFLVPQLYNARRYGVDLLPFPALVAIDARASALPAFIAAHPDQQPDAPTAK